MFVEHVAAQARRGFAGVVVGAVQVVDLGVAERLGEVDPLHLGGRAAFGKLKSRFQTGTITLSTPASVTPRKRQARSGRTTRTAALVMRTASSATLRRLTLRTARPPSTGGETQLESEE